MIDLRKQFEEARRLSEYSAASAVGMGMISAASALHALVNVVHRDTVGIVADLAVGALVGTTGFFMARQFRKAANEVTEKALKDVASAMSQPVEQFRVPEGKVIPPSTGPK